MNIELGVTYMDRITGFRGVATGRVAYISGCNQALLTPRVKEDGAFMEAQWFDEQRLEIVEGIAAILIDNVSGNGFDSPAPKR